MISVTSPRPPQATCREEVVRRMLNEHSDDELLRDCYYDEPRVQAAERFRATEEWSAVLAILPSPPGKILDLGCGHGIASVALERSGWNVVSVEPSPGLLLGVDAAARVLSEADCPSRCLQGVGEGLPFRDGSFDAVYCRQVFHHTQDLRSVCAEVSRVLRPGGRVVACAEHVISSQRQLERFLAAHPFHRYSRDEAAFPVQHYQRAIRAAGLALTTIRPLESPINVAPNTMASLQHELVHRVNRIPLAGLVMKLLLTPTRRRFTLGLLSRVDRRPGRPFTFIGQKARR